MIIFQSVTVQNFLSVGNHPLKVILNEHHITTITGPSGSGKSLLVTDALVFGIFGKPYRDINKPQLVNAINKKNCLVTIEFLCNNIQYKVVRGIKPTVFEIYSNGVMLNQDAASRDYQFVLEQQILKLNYKTFTQVVILGSASYIPFMQLPPLQRREVVENILDIGVFSTMSQLLKERSAVNKDQLTLIDKELTIIKNKVDSQKKLIESLVNSKQDQLKAIYTKIRDNNEFITNTNEFVTTTQNTLAQLQEQLQNSADVINEHSIHKTLATKINSKMELLQKNLKFFQKHDVCPSCTQQIHHDHKHQHLTSLNQEIITSEQELDTIQDKINELGKIIKEHQGIMEQQRSLNIYLATLNQTLMMLNDANDKLNREILAISDDRNNIEEEKVLLKSLATSALKLVENKTLATEQQQIYNVGLGLLKDDGIKTAIIKEYLPSINKIINYYLGILDLYVKFELDTSLNETVKSRGRDIFSYNSFSEGEKSRLSIALMLTWRSIAKSKGAVFTNLLILDEIFSQHLDPVGIQSVKDLLVQDLTDNNIFVITHTHVDEFKAISNNVLEIKKSGDFSTIVNEV